MMANDYQLLRVDLTSPNGMTSERLTDSFKRLRRASEKKFANYKIEFFKVHTSEGNGVLHMLWAIKHDRPVWIAQSWLSDEWEKISGARVVWVKRVGVKYVDRKKITKYMVSHYLAGQNKIVRVSWSWWRSMLSIGRAWKEFTRETRRGSVESRMAGLSPFTEDIDRKKMVEGWNKILTFGFWFIGGTVFFISGRSIDMGVL